MGTVIGENYSWPHALLPLYANSNFALRMDINDLKQQMAESFKQIKELNQNLERINSILIINGSSQPVSYFLKNTNSVINRKKENYK